MRKLKRRVERLERYSRDFNIRVVGVVEEDGEDCLLIIRNYLTLLGFEDDLGEIENAHRTGRKGEEKPRNIMGNLICMIFGALKIPQSRVFRGVSQNH